MEQISLFDEEKTDIAELLCKELNQLETHWKGTFFIEQVELKEWEYIKSKNKNLTIIIKTTLPQDLNNQKNNFMMWNNEEDTKKLNQQLYESKLIKKLYKDNDFSISLSPWLIFIFYHNFELKDISKLGVM